jgi:peroxiredoxin
LAGFGKLESELAAVGAKVVVAASVDPLDKAKEVAADAGLPVAYGVTREMGEKVGAWWDERRRIVDPAEFVVGQDGTVMVSSYSSGPLGRMDAADVVRLIKFREAQAKK